MGQLTALKEYCQKLETKYNTLVEQYNKNLNPKDVVDKVDLLFHEVTTFRENLRNDKKLDKNDVNFKVISTQIDNVFNGVGDFFGFLKSLDSSSKKRAHSDDTTEPLNRQRVDEPPPLPPRPKTSNYTEIRQLVNPEDRTLRERLPLETLKKFKPEEYNLRIDEIKAYGYSDFQQVKGDGNCFYRAFYVQALQQGLKEGQGSPTLMNLISLFLDLEVKEPELQEQKRRIVGLLYWAHDSGKWIGGKDLIEHAATNEVVDQAFIRLLREVGAKYISENFDIDLHGVTPKVIIESTGSTVEQFCQEMRKMGVEAEEMAVMLLPHALRTKLNIAMLEGKDTYLETYGDKSESRVVDMLFRPTHYDILYRGGAV